MAQNDPKDMLPKEYDVIFQQLESAEADEVDLLREELDEINELRKIVAEISEPDVLYASSSQCEPDLAFNIRLNFTN